MVHDSRFLLFKHRIVEITPPLIKVLLLKILTNIYLIIKFFYI